MSPDTDPSELLTAWATGLQSSLNGAPRRTLRQGLLARVAASAQAHAEYRTVRREASPWLRGGEGARLRWLRQDSAESVALIALDQGALLPEPPQAVAVEYLLTQGCLHEPSTGVQIPTWSHAVQRAGALTALRSSGPSTLYRRVLGTPMSERPPAEAGWWAAQIKSASNPTHPGGWRLPGEWVSNRAGVTVLPLAVHRQVVSMLVRFEAGSGVPDHGHEIDEDCLVLDGEMFLGDILLRAGDYQLAPAGGSHFGETSDTGALFFFHGALDTALRGPRS